MSALPVTSRSTEVTVDFIVSAPPSGDGAAVDYSDASISAQLCNTGTSRANDQCKALYRVDSGQWMTLPPGSEQSVSIDFATQALTMKFAGDVSISMTVTGVPSGLYAGDTALPGGSVTSAAISAAIAIAPITAPVGPMTPPNQSPG